MTEAPASRPKKPFTWRGVRDSVAAHPTASSVGLYALVAIAAGIVAYLTIFTRFGGYDDEGTLLVTLNSFAHGEVLYREIYSGYGPFYYELFGGLLALSGHTITTDASREIVVAIWVATSLLFGLTSQRLSGSLMLGASGMLVTFGALGVLTNEPMHPQGLSVFLIAAFVLLAVSGPRRRTALAGAGAGALIAALALTKVNLGAFAFAAVALAAVLALEPLRRRRWVLWPVIVAFLAMPLFILARDLNESWVRDLLLLEVLSATAVIVAAWSPRPKRDEDDGGLARWLLAAGVGLAATTVVVLAIVLLTGPTPSEVYDGVIGNALKVRDILTIPLSLAPATVDWAIVAVAAAAIVSRLRSEDDGPPSIWPGLLRAAAGLTIWFSVIRIAPIALNPSPGNPEALPMVLAWVAAIPPFGRAEPSYRRFVRVLLPALALAETLQVYPVAGSQTGIAAFVFVPVGALCLADALSCLRAWSTARGPGALERFGAVAAIVTTAIAGLFALDAVVRPGGANLMLYREQSALSARGASQLHLPQLDIETYEGVLNLLHKYRCTTFVGYPNVDSLYLWSGIEAPPPILPGDWMDAIDAKTQQRVVNGMRDSPRPCLIRSDTRAEFWLGGVPPANRPLVRYIANGFEPVAEAGDFKFLLPKARVRRGSP